MENPKHPLLGAHPLKSTNNRYWEFHITDNYVVIFKPVKEGYAFFKIGTHGIVDKY
jgi:mRNA-degrading endonuclease YafQ of YafQ-DinJ toxin-antitoxin module